MQFERLQCVRIVSDFRFGTPWTVLGQPLLPRTAPPDATGPTSALRILQHLGWFLRPAWWETQLRMAPTGASEPADTAG